MIYAVVHLTVTNEDTFAAYAAEAGPALAKYGAKPVAVSKAPIVLEGDATAPTRSVVLSFPDEDAALGWIGDENFAETHAKRRASGVSNIVLLA